MSDERKIMKTGTKAVVDNVFEPVKDIILIAEESPTRDGACLCRFIALYENDENRKRKAFAPLTPGFNSFAFS